MRRITITMTLIAVALAAAMTIPWVLAASSGQSVQEYRCKSGTCIHNEGDPQNPNDDITCNSGGCPCPDVKYTYALKIVEGFNSLVVTEDATGCVDCSITKLHKLWAGCGGHAEQPYADYWLGDETGRVVFNTSETEETIAVGSIRPEGGSVVSLGQYLWNHRECIGWWVCAASVSKTTGSQCGTCKLKSGTVVRLDEWEE